MKLCIDYLRQLEHEKGWSRFRMAKELGISSARMYQLYDQGGTYDDHTAVALAKALGVDPVEVVTAAHLERSKDPEVKAVWTAILEKISVGFESLLLHGFARRSPLGAMR